MSNLEYEFDGRKHPVKPWVIKEVNGIKVGIFGIIGQDAFRFLRPPELNLAEINDAELRRTVSPK